MAEPPVPGDALQEFDGTVLAALLELIERHDTSYQRRYPLVLEAVAVAWRMGYPAGFRLDPQEPDWPVAVIELPTGQVSWHLPAHAVAWDGHTTAEKYQRCRNYRRLRGLRLPEDSDG